MYHPYKQGYHTRPALEKLEEEPFHKDADYDNFIKEKHKALRRFVWTAARQEVELKHDCDPEIISTVESFIQSKADWVDPNSDISSIALQIQEDIAIHRTKDGKDWLAYTNISFPSSWRPEEKIGKSLVEIHSPVPGMNLSNSYKMAEACTQKGPFRRFVWTPVFDNKINLHPSMSKKKFDPENPFIKVKVERQITWPFPELNCFLFILRQYIVDPDIKELYEACSAMNEEQRKYKGVEQNFIDAMKEMN